MQDCNISLSHSKGQELSGFLSRLVIYAKSAPISLCSDIFGGIVSRKFGYGQVTLRKRIAFGDAGCEVAINFRSTDQEQKDVYETLRPISEGGKPFSWEEDIILFLDEQLRQSDQLVMKLPE